MTTLLPVGYAHLSSEPEEEGVKLCALVYSPAPACFAAGTAQHYLVYLTIYLSNYLSIYLTINCY